MAFTVAGASGSDLASATRASRLAAISEAGARADQLDAFALEIVDEAPLSLLGLLGIERTGEILRDTARRGRGVGGEALQLVAEILMAPELVGETLTPARRHVGRFQKCAKEPEVADAQLHAAEARGLQSPDDERHGLGFGALAVGAAESLDAGLAELARVRLVGVLRLKAEGGAVVAILRRAACRPSCARGAGGRSAR